jgi:hypothetical protein
MNTSEAAEYCRSSASTLAKYRLLNRGPTLIRIGRRILYDPSDLDVWLDANRYTRGKRVAS